MVKEERLVVLSLSFHVMILHNSRVHTIRIALFVLEWDIVPQVHFKLNH